MKPNSKSQYRRLKAQVGSSKKPLCCWCFLPTKKGQEFCSKECFELYSTRMADFNDYCKKSPKE